MSDSAPGAAPAAERRAWLRDRRRVDEQQEDALAGDYDTDWGEIEPMHHSFVGCSCPGCRPTAGCWTRSAAPASTSRWCWPPAACCSGWTTPAPRWPSPPRSSPRSPPSGTTCRSCPTGVSSTACCVWTPWLVPPEEWPPVLERFRRALHSGGWLYLTVERAPADRVRAARAVGGPTTLTAAAADNGVGWNVLSYRPVDSRPTGAVEDIGWTWLGQGRLTAHYFAPHGQQRPA
jgi:hypothetical protein